MSVPGCVVHRHEHTRVADGEDVDFIFDGFVHDAVGFDDELYQKVIYFWYNISVFMEERRKGQLWKTHSSMAVW